MASERTKELVAAAEKELGRLCEEIWAGGRGWRWSIPVNEERDSDCILANAWRAQAKEIESLETARSSLVAENERLRGAILTHTATILDDATLQEKIDALQTLRALGCQPTQEGR